MAEAENKQSNTPIYDQMMREWNEKKSCPPNKAVDTDAK